MFRFQTSLLAVLTFIALMLSAAAGVYAPPCGKRSGSTEAADDLSNVTCPGVHENIIVTAYVATNAASTAASPFGVWLDEYQAPQLVRA